MIVPSALTREQMAELPMFQATKYSGVKEISPIDL